MPLKLRPTALGSTEIPGRQVYLAVPRRRGDAGQHPPQGRHGVRLNEHLEHDCGLTVFQHACRMGLKGIVSKRLGSRYRSGRSPDWLKFKNPEAPAVRREAEEDWGR